MLDFSLHLDNPDQTSFLRPSRYLKGGMSQYPYRMMANAVSKGVRVFAGEAVLSIDSGMDTRFVIRTEKRTIVADRIINAIDAFAFGKIAGNVARDIQNTKQFQDLKYTSCATVDAWWDDRFWERSQLLQGNTLLQISNHDECFNLMIIPNYPYVKGSNGTRAAYDDGVCVETWRDLLNSGNASLLREEIRAGMQRVFTDVVVPLPRTVKGTLHYPIGN
ncbi:hypothetical protein RvY_03849-4 [Ramazzottius varieornatus]|uniref:Amine oxidase domain-containing protein n=1 Tax=Ramazzottius varieornatus TaxID=947166 RepID=A0A1D1UWK0_RAMVA|nr:hypothetical protein RvY_03849-4 [Ramazzottius varieornatus]